MLGRWAWLSQGTTTTSTDVMQIIMANVAFAL
jgi:hypothetical protein